MNKGNPTDIPVEVEAKFPGGEMECRAIVDYLVSHGAFACESLAPKHRMHVYFDAGRVLHNCGCRLRCVVAPGEWCRYDFKAEDLSGGGETLEVSIKKPAPVHIAAVIQELLLQFQDGSHQKILGEIQDDVNIALVMLGEHRKTLARRADLELEVSWDRLTLVDTGGLISEIEVELKSGPRELFDRTVQDIEREVGVNRIQTAKYAQALLLKIRQHG